MSAYATLRKASLPTADLRALPAQLQDAAVDHLRSRPAADAGNFIELLVDQLADRVAAAVASRLSPPSCEPAPEWLDSRAAAIYLGVHRDTLRKLAAERAIPSEQEGRGCKLFFRRADLDEWRRAGGRAGHLSTTFAAA